ncbi:DUF1287 domain-containing protein [Cellvibrio sp. UBA7671]|uniref:DUF1287 domain-containing protein n=1 Tax=Cellvibrio sp. UBA7671 TaxID=1946312 RepID=UPI002F3522CF
MSRLFTALVSSLVILIAQHSSAENIARTTNNAQTLVAAAVAQTQDNVTYNGAYFNISYPMGDVPAQYGVCTDVIIRAYRKLGIDLQQLVHEDMRGNFSLYPAKKNWGQTKTDSNIDHRRVPNLQTFFTRHGKKLIASSESQDYQAGDLVTWILPGNLPHIGIVSDQYSADGLRPLIVHNIGAGPKLEDMLFDYTISGHYRYALF